MRDFFPLLWAAPLHGSPGFSQGRRVEGGGREGRGGEVGGSEVGLTKRS